MRENTKVRGSARLVIGLFALIALAVTGSACGPIQSTTRLNQAAVALERARVAEADRRAPYEYYSARFFLHKAEEEWSYSDFEASHKFATDARRAAEAAVLKAKEDPWEGSPVDPELTQEALRDLGSQSIDMTSE